MSGGTTMQAADRKRPRPRGAAAIGEHLQEVRYDQLRRGNDRLHGLVRGLGLRLCLEREGHEWTTVNANNVEA
jgi:hypothetical protein